MGQNTETLHNPFKSEMTTSSAFNQPPSPSPSSSSTLNRVNKLSRTLSEYPNLDKNLAKKTRNSFRFFVAFLGTWACILLCSTRYNLSVAIVSMVDSYRTGHGICTHHLHFENVNDQSILDEIYHNQHLNKTSAKSNKINWTEEQQGFSLGSYYYGFAATHVFGGRFAERYGPKWVTATGLFAAALLNALLPMAANLNFYFFVSLRVIIGAFHGVVHPALYFMFKNWFPPKEQTIALSFLLIGNALGLIINVPISMFISKVTTNSLVNWTLLFYGGSALHLIWLFLWLFLITDYPENHRLIKEKEIFYIRQNSKNVLETDLKKVPWSSILRSKVLYASIIAKLCWSFNYSVIIDLGPSYLHKVFDFDMLQASLHIAIIYSLAIVIFLFSPPLFSIINHWTSNYIRLTRLRKIFQALVFLGASITMMWMARIKCNLHLIQILIIINMITQGFISVGENPIIPEFAGNFSGTVYGIAITFDSFARFLAPIIRAELVKKSNTLENWNSVFYITGFLNLIGLIVFEFCATTSLKKWALKKEFVKQISMNGDKIEKPIKKELKLELQNPHYRLDINTETDDWRHFKSSTLVA